jgi:hypothetical protein
MKKIPKSITALITTDDKGNLYYRKQSALKSDISDMISFGIKISSGSYKVTYTLSRRGKFIVVDMDPPAIRPAKNGADDGPSSSPFAHICFLPTKWIGKRVSRKVTPIKVKK